MISKFIDWPALILRFLILIRPTPYSEDVQWFKPVRLHSKYGHTGHIRNHWVLVHGHMKCVFDSPIKQQDTVMMYLYKRVYPKWGTTEIWNGGLEDKIVEDEIRERKMEM